LKQFAKTRTMIKISHNNKMIASALYCNYGTTQTRSKATTCLDLNMYSEMCKKATPKNVDQFDRFDLAA